MNKMSSGAKKLRVIGVIVIMLLVANFGYQVWERYYAMATPQHVSREPCDLQDKACRIYMPDGQMIQFDIHPRNISAEEPLDFAVNIANINANNVHFSLFALDNKEIQPQHRVMEKYSKHRYRAQATLNHSNQDNEQWLAIIIIETDDGDIAAPYKFQLSK